MKMANNPDRERILSYDLLLGRNTNLCTQCNYRGHIEKMQTSASNLAPARKMMPTMKATGSSSWSFLRMTVAGS